jgi:hypothetical protein
MGHNCPSLCSGQFRGQIGFGPQEKFQEMPHSAFCPRPKKVIFRTFRIRGTLVFLCPKDKEEEGREGERERGRERRGERERERERKRMIKRKRKKVRAGDYISKPTRPE